MIKVNGEELTGLEGVTVAELIKQQGYKTTYVAIELNNEILPRAEFDTAVVKEGDVMEIVCFMGGGQ